MSAEQWDFDLSHSSIGFHVRHLMISKVHGRFSSWTGSLHLDPIDPTQSRVEVQIDAASIDTKEPKRDDHLRSADFFDAANFPHLTFKSTRVERDGDDLAVDGELTIHGVTRPVHLKVEPAGQVKDPWGGTRTGFSAKTTISRKDFGLTWNQLLEAGGVAVGDKIEISLEIEAVKKVATVAA
jgi:polyisoprenoid-binding protein YceI